MLSSIWQQNGRCMQRDDLRSLIDLACRTGKKFCAQKSGYVTDEEGNICLYDNFLFVLALFRTKSHEHIQEGAKLLEKLLYLQQSFSELEFFGAYPLFLHDFPTRCDRQTSVRILRVLFWIKKEFCHVLCKKLVKKLEVAVGRLLAYCQKELELYDLPIHLECSIEALLFAFDVKKASATTVQEDALVMLDPECLAELIASYQVAPSLCDFSPLWRHLTKSWHAPSCSYAGPGFSLYQEGYEPKVTLYDYYMALFTENFAKRTDNEMLHALSAALVWQEHALEESVLPHHDHGQYKGFTWSRYCCTLYAVSCIKGSPDPKQKPVFYPFYLISATHTLVMQPHIGSLVAYTCEGKSVKMEIDFAKECFAQEKEVPKVLSFWFDNTSKTNLTIQGTKASCFSLEEPVNITLSELQITLRCRQVFGDGQFLWHVIRSNRPSQKRTNEKFQAYDVELFLRPLRGSCASRIEIVLGTVQK